MFIVIHIEASLHLLAGRNSIESLHGQGLLRRCCARLCRASNVSSSSLPHTDLLKLSFRLCHSLDLSDFCRASSIPSSSPPQTWVGGEIGTDCITSLTVWMCHVRCGRACSVSGSLTPRTCFVKEGVTFMPGPCIKRPRNLPCAKAKPWHIIWAAGHCFAEKLAVAEWARGG